ncbi:MAG: maleylpyruvate isomerase N-terminal domain-containing protein [Actinobacteria bacterium]|nr:maleylpyruvate isomerase N-terminal domain-containing protein [Actinomycetota bacterium]
MPSGADIVAAVAAKQTAVIRALRALTEDELRAPSSLPDWSRLTVVCHIRFGAEAINRLVTAALAGEPALFYPGGRDEQRPGTLVPAPGESPHDVVESLAANGGALDATLAAVTDWTVMSREPHGAADLGPMTVERLALLRLTEVEVHAADMQIGLDTWSDTFVDAALPMRFERLALPLSNSPVPTHRPTGTWLLRSTDGDAWFVVAGEGGVASRTARPDESADGVIEASRRNLLALLLGRSAEGVFTYTGADDGAFARGFKAAFPGP